MMAGTRTVGPGAEVLQVFTALPDAESAERLARMLVEEGNAACVQVVGPVSSTYRWQGRVEHAREWLCLARTNRARYAALEAAVIRVHPYDTPEVVAVPVAAGSRRYLDWLSACLARGQDGERD